MYGIFSCYYVCMHCTFGCHVPLSFQQQSVTNTVKSVKNLASAENARKGIQSKTANVNVSPPFYMVVRFKFVFSCYYVCMHCTFGCHVPLSFQQQSVTNTVKSVENLASAKNARKSIQSKTANVNVSPTFYMVVRFKLECYWYTLKCIT